MTDVRWHHITIEGRLTSFFNDISAEICRSPLVVLGYQIDDEQVKMREHRGEKASARKK